MGGGDLGACGVAASSLFGFLALGLDTLGADWCVGVGDGSLLSFFLLFQGPLVWLVLSFDWSFLLRVLFCQDCIFVLHIFNKLMKDKTSLQM